MCCLGGHNLSTMSSEWTSCLHSRVSEGQCCCCRTSHAGRTIEYRACHRAASILAVVKDKTRHPRQTAIGGNRCLHKTRLGCLRSTKFCWIGKHVNIMKPTSPQTQGQPYPRKNRLKVAFAPLFPHSKYSFRGLGLIYIGNRLIET